MLEQLNYLIRFQILEDKKAQLIRNRDETPKRVAEIERDYQRFEAEVLAKRAEYEQAKKAHKSLDHSVSDLETRITRSRSRMSEVKTNKEYQAILKEIDDLKKEITGKEDQVLELMEKGDSLGKELKVLEKDLEVRKKKLELEKEELRIEVEKVSERLNRLEALQDKIRVKMEAEVLKRCEFILKKQGGIAVAAVQEGICQICHLNIPPQKYIELQRDENLQQCPHCHRYIYWPGHEAYKIYEEELEEEM